VLGTSLRSAVQTTRCQLARAGCDRCRFVPASAGAPGVARGPPRHLGDRPGLATGCTRSTPGLRPGVRLRAATTAALNRVRGMPRYSRSCIPGWPCQAQFSLTRTRRGAQQLAACGPSRVARQASPAVQAGRLRRAALLVPSPTLRACSRCARARPCAANPRPCCAARCPRRRLVSNRLPAAPEASRGDTW
jgi:hypothetical protein